MIYWIGLLACRFLAFCPPFCYTYLIKEMGFYETENRGYSFAGGAVQMCIRDRAITMSSMEMVAIFSRKLDLKIS